MKSFPTNRTTFVIYGILVSRADMVSVMPQELWVMDGDYVNYDGTSENLANYLKCNVEVEHEQWVIVPLHMDTDDMCCIDEHDIKRTSDGKPAVGNNTDALALPSKKAMNEMAVIHKKLRAMIQKGKRRLKSQKIASMWSDDLEEIKPKIHLIVSFEEEDFSVTLRKKTITLPME